MQALLNNFESLVHHSPLLAMLAAWIAGIFVSFSPCVYPVIPLTLGVIGARSAGSKYKGFFLSLLYVSGMSLTYAVLGSIAGLTGTMFGSISTSPWTYFIVANITLIFGVTMVVDFSLPSIGVFHKSAHKNRDGLLGVFLMGALSGLIVGPCTAPALATILVYVGTQENFFYGFSLLLAFGFGIGFLFILLGTFTGLLASMPKSGLWLKRIKQLFGVLMILVGEMLFLKMGGLL